AGATHDALRSGPFESGGKSISDIFRFAAELPRLSRDIAKLAAHHSAGILYVNGPRLLPAARLAMPVRLVFHCHSYLGQRYAAALAGISAAGATVIANSHFAAKPLRLYTRPNVIYNGVCRCPYRAATVRERSLAPVRRIGVIGRIAPEKGQ